MRFIILSMPLFLAACGAGPAAFGITGPGPVAVPPASSGPFDVAPTPYQYAPGIGPNSGSGRFWGYN